MNKRRGKIKEIEQISSIVIECDVYDICIVTIVFRLLKCRKIKVTHEEIYFSVVPKMERTMEGKTRMENAEGTHVGED